MAYCKMIDKLTIYTDSRQSISTKQPISTPPPIQNEPDLIIMRREMADRMYQENAPLHYMDDVDWKKLYEKIYVYPISKKWGIFFPPFKNNPPNIPILHTKYNHSIR